MKLPRRNFLHLAAGAAALPAASRIAEHILKSKNGSFTVSPSFEPLLAKRFETTKTRSGHRELL